MQRYLAGVLLIQDIECLGSSMCQLSTDLSAIAYIHYIVSLRTVYNSCGLMLMFGVISVHNSST